MKLNNYKAKNKYKYEHTKAYQKNVHLHYGQNTDSIVSPILNGFYAKPYKRIAKYSNFQPFSANV